MIRAIFWDNDGILVDTEELYFRSNRDTFAKMGIELTREEFIELSLVKGIGLWPFAEKNGLSRQDFEDFKTPRNELYLELTSEGNMLIDHVYETLRELHGKYIMGIVTSELRYIFESIHRNTGILKHMDFVIAGGEYEHYKPHPAPYIKALKLSGCKPEDCIAVEDSPRGAESAISAGIKCLAIPRGITKGLAFPGVWKILPDVSFVPLALLSD